MPTLKKLIKQMEQNDPYINKINEIIQQDKQTKHILRGLMNDINFEANFKNYKLVAKPKIIYGACSDFYYLTIKKKW